MIYGTRDQLDTVAGLSDRGIRQAEAEQAHFAYSEGKVSRGYDGEATRPASFMSETYERLSRVNDRLADLGQRMTQKHYEQFGPLPPTPASVTNGANAVEPSNTADVIRERLRAIESWLSDIEDCANSLFQQL